MSVLAISFSKHIVSPLEILQEGKEISSSNWDLCGPDLCSPKQLWRISGSVGAGCPITRLLLHCPAALSHQAGTFRVAHGDMWQSSGPGAQLHALDLGPWGPPGHWGTCNTAPNLCPASWAWVHSSQARQDCWAIGTKDPKNQGGSRAALHMSGPGAASWGAVAGTASGGSSAGAASAAGWGNISHGLQRGARKEKGEKEDWADTLLEATEQKSRQFWGEKFSTLEMQIELPWSPCSKGEVAAKCKFLSWLMQSHLLHVVTQAPVVVAQA